MTIFKKIVFLLAALAISQYSSKIIAQELTIKKAPKQISFEAGYRNVFVIMDKSATPYNNDASNGYGFLFDYGWKLSGLDGKKPGVYLTVPMGYSVLFPDNSSSKKMSMLNYGWSLRHELSKNPNIVPFIGYGLFLNNFKTEGTLGSIMGHQTQFEGGLNFNTPTRLKYFAKIQCSYTSYPKMGATEKIHLMYADMRVGVRF